MLPRTIGMIPRLLCELFLCIASLLYWLSLISDNFPLKIRQECRRVTSMYSPLRVSLGSNLNIMNKFFSQ